MISLELFNSSYGELVTRWTVRLAVLAYFVGAALRAGHGSSGQQKLAGAVWTMGSMFYLAHVACAFQFFHHWSHAAAYQRTAEQTAAVTGWNWGGGLYFNYVFTAVWLADTVMLWLSTSYGPGTRWLEAAIQVFLWFMVFNATVVFGHGLVRWFGLTGCGWLAVLTAQRFARPRAVR